jgi:hypothetical protein
LQQVVTYGENLGRNVTYFVTATDAHPCEGFFAAHQMAVDCLSANYSPTYAALMIAEDKIRQAKKGLQVPFYYSEVGTL